MNIELFSQVDDYISNLFAPEDKVLTDTIKSLDKENILLLYIECSFV